MTKTFSKKKRKVTSIKRFILFQIFSYLALLKGLNLFVDVQFLSCAQLFAIPWTVAYQACRSFTISWSLLKFTSIESVMPSNHLIFYHPLLLLPSLFPSIRVFSSELAVHNTWPKYWSSSFSFGPSKEDSGLISFRIDWFHLLLFMGLSRVFSTTV